MRETTNGVCVRQKIAPQSAEKSLAPSCRSIQVVTGDGTRYRIPGVQGPGLADVQVGDRVVVLGRFEGGDRTVFLAQGLGVVPPFDDGSQP